MRNLVDGVGGVSGEHHFFGVMRPDERAERTSGRGHRPGYLGAVAVDRTAATARVLGVVFRDGIDDGLWFEGDAGVVEVGRCMFPLEGREVLASFVHDFTTLLDRAGNRARGR